MTGGMTGGGGVNLPRRVSRAAGRRAVVNAGGHGGAGTACGHGGDVNRPG
jgi:hypothetical protein